MYALPPLVYTPVVCVECMSSELASSDVCLYLVLRILERATVCNVQDVEERDRQIVGVVKYQRFD